MKLALLECLYLRQIKNCHVLILKAAYALNNSTRGLCDLCVTALETVARSSRPAASWDLGASWGGEVRWIRHESRQGATDIWRPDWLLLRFHPLHFALYGCADAV